MKKISLQNLGLLFFAISGISTLKASKQGGISQAQSNVARGFNNVSQQQSSAAKASNIGDSNAPARLDAVSQKQSNVAIAKNEVSRAQSKYAKAQNNAK